MNTQTMKAQAKQSIANMRQYTPLSAVQKAVIDYHEKVIELIAENETAAKAYQGVFKAAEKLRVGKAELQQRVLALKAENKGLSGSHKYANESLDKLSKANEAVTAENAIFRKALEGFKNHPSCAWCGSVSIANTLLPQHRLTISTCICATWCVCNPSHGQLFVRCFWYGSRIFFWPFLAPFLVVWHHRTTCPMVV